MKNAAIFLIALLLFQPNTASAVTYTYTGTNYDNTGYSSGSSFEPIGYTLRGPYDESMALTFSFTIDGLLAPNTTIRLFDFISPVREVTAFDGIDNFIGSKINDIGPSEVTTDNEGKIVSWYFNVCSISCDTDGIFLESRYKSGTLDESVFFNYQYACNPEPDIQCFASEIAVASASEVGSWSVPLPASLPLLAVGFLGAGFWGRRRKASRYIPD